MFDIGLGDKGMPKSYQANWKQTTDCVCGHRATIAFAGKDDGEVSKLHLNSDDNKWVGKMSFATYICRKCLKATTLINWEK